MTLRSVAIGLAIVSAILIVVGRVYRLRSWGNWVAVAGYGLLGLGAIVALVGGR
jgi:hypothetical protein